MAGTMALHRAAPLLAKILKQFDWRPNLERITIQPTHLIQLKGVGSGLTSDRQTAITDAKLLQLHGQAMTPKRIVMDATRDDPNL